MKIPANGFFVDSSYGPSWKCERGYHAADTTCVALAMPENAHLDYQGNDWACNRPFKKRGERCEMP